MLALPIALQQLITFAVGFTDNLMVGSLGDTAISGVYMGNQIQILLQFVMGGIGGALGILSAQYWGIKDLDSIKTILAIACRFALCVGLVLSVIAISIPSELINLFTNDEAVIAEGASYLRVISCSYVFFCFSQILVAAMRSIEKANVGMVLSFITLITNFTLNNIFIFGRFGLPALGAKGAALGTLISRIIEFILIFIYVTRFDKKLGMKVKDFLRTNKNLVKDFIRYGLPVVFGDVVWSINVLSQSAILGHLSAQAITAVSIASMLHNIAYIWVLALGLAIAILTSKTVGAGKFELMKEYAKTIQIMMIIVGLLTGLILFIIKGPFLSLYSVSDEAAVIANQMMSVLCITIIGSSYQAPCLSGLVKAGGDTGFVFKNDSIFVFCVVLPAGLFSMLLGAPAWVVFACLKLDQILKCIVAVVKINSFNWMKNLTRTNTK